MISNTTYGRISQGLGTLGLVGSALVLRQANKHMMSHTLGLGITLLINSVALAALGLNAILAGSRLVKTKEA